MAPERVPALIFTLRGQGYGLLQDGAAALLPWLQRYTPVSPVPGVPAWLLGLLHVQGTVQAIVDLGLFMGHGEGARAAQTRLIFVEREELCAGLLVDSAAGVRYLDRIDYDGEAGGHPLLAATATMNGEPVRIIDGARLIESLARALGALDTPGAIAASTTPATTPATSGRSA